MPDVKIQNSVKDKYSHIIFDAIYTHLQAPSIIQKIKDNALDLKAIYLNPTKENVQKVLDLLELPKTSTILL